MKCVCFACGGESIRGLGFGLYQSCGNGGSVGRVSVLRWCRWGVGQSLEGWCYVCVSCESGLFV